MLGAEREGKRREGNRVVRAERQRRGGERAGETRREQRVRGRKMGSMGGIEIDSVKCSSRWKIIDSRG